MIQRYNITGMSCSKCVAAVQQKISKNEKVQSVIVQLEAPQATIESYMDIDLDELQKAVSQAGGYQINYASLIDKTKEYRESTTSYFPLYLIFGFITGLSFLAQVFRYSFSWLLWMRYFMAGFFLIFSFFKFLDLKGFVKGFSSYDIIADKFKAWSFIYPFVELGLGIMFFIGLAPIGTNIATFIIMLIGSIGIVRRLSQKAIISCACLGTAIQLPLGKISLAENLLMAVMSLLMLTMIW